MARSAYVLGGTGQIGSAVALRLAAAGWDVTVAARTRERLSSAVRKVAQFVSVDREAGLSLPGDVDALVDVISMTHADAEQLLALKGKVGAVVAISSVSVYADAEGRTLDEAEDEETFPRLPVPIPETQRTVEPGDATYSTQKIAMERTLLEQDHVSAIVVRPCAVYGPGGEFRSRSGVFNCGDPEPPSMLEIGRIIAHVLEHEWTECLLPGAELGYRPVVAYSEAVAETCRWLAEERPPLGDYMETFFDYAAEDSFVRALAG